jgi:hypothetical protein
MEITNLVMNETYQFVAYIIWEEQWGANDAGIASDMTQKLQLALNRAVALMSRSTNFTVPYTYT